MTETNENTPVDKALAAQGATPEDVSDSTSKEGSPAPVIQDRAPAKEQKTESKEEEPKDEAPEVPEDKPKEEEEEESTTKDTDDYPVYGDEAADSIVGILKESGISLKEAEGIFGTKEGRTPADIDVAKLTEKLGKAKSAAVMALVQDFYQRNVQSVQEIGDAVFAETGGKEAFKKISEYAKAREKTDPEFKKDLDAYRKMLESGKTQAVLAARELLKAYNADPKNKTLQIRITDGDTPASIGEAPITRAEYLERMKEADAKRDYAEINRLRIARQAGKRAGI